MEPTRNQIWKHQKNGKFIEVKEVTFYNEEKPHIAYVVTGNLCDFMSDAHTTRVRLVYPGVDFLRLYSYVCTRTEIGYESKGL